MDLLIDFILGISVLGWVLNLTKLLRRSDVPPEYNLDFEFENASGRAHDSDAETNYPSLSVLIPARDEVINIEEALTHALAIKWPNDLEVIVVDDRSTDGTSELLAELATNEPRLRIIQGQEPSAGWLGKPHALYIGEQNANGDLLLFLDADVRVAPDGLLKTWHRMLKDGVGMVSVLGKLETGSFFEHVIQPRLGAILLGGNPLGLVNDPESERVLASGQFLLFDRSAYHRIGGHEGIRDSVLDDVDLATKAKQSDEGFRLYFGNTVFRCRMYRGLGEIWSGWSKNLFPAMHYSLLSTALVVLLISLWTWVPFTGLALLGYPELDFPAYRVWLYLTMLALILLSDAVGHAINGYNWRYFWTFPLGFLVIVLLFANSAIRIRFGSGAQWKGRAVETPVQRRLKAERTAKPPNSD